MGKVIQELLTLAVTLQEHPIEQVLGKSDREVAFDVLTGMLTPWLVIPVFMAVLTRVFIRVEEAMLTETFGEAYQAYKRRVRRWL